MLLNNSIDCACNQTNGIACCAQQRTAYAHPHKIKMTKCNMQTNENSISTRFHFRWFNLLFDKYGTSGFNIEWNIQTKWKEQMNQTRKCAKYFSWQLNLKWWCSKVKQELCSLFGEQNGPFGSNRIIEIHHFHLIACNYCMRILDWCSFAFEFLSQFYHSMEIRNRLAEASSVPLRYLKWKAHSW